MKKHYGELITDSRHFMRNMAPAALLNEAEEGGCGVTGFACTIPVGGRHIFEPSVQMHNRGNGKGGGVAAVGLVPDQLGVDQATLENDYLLQIALLDEKVIRELEDTFIRPHFKVDHESFLETIDDYRDLPGLEIRPPTVKRYFVRVKPDALSRFQREKGLQDLAVEKAEEEFIYQNTFSLNRTYYSSLGEKRAFVLSHGRNMMILKMVGYAEQVAQYYRLEQFKAHIWIAHQRYPTKGRVWHPGGAHPFIGMNEALVHNGDFANYYSVAEHLKQHNVYPLFLTDTEVSVQVFDLLNRVYGYPLEYIIEALAPTGEMDFDHLSPERQRIYRQIQATHIHGSPDGPWFFIIARTMPAEQKFQLIGITDTAMLRPQVFALQDGEFQVGLICSEKQAIDATLHSLASEDPRFGTVADKYWNARGGSYTDGGSFIFTLSGGDEGYAMKCTDKFGREVTVSGDQEPYDFSRMEQPVEIGGEAEREVERMLAKGDVEDIRRFFVDGLAEWDYEKTRSYLSCLEILSCDNSLKEQVIDLLTFLIDSRYSTGTKRRRSVLQMFSASLDCIFRGVPLLKEKEAVPYLRIDLATRRDLRPPKEGERTLVADAVGFEAEGDNSFARLISDAFLEGWKRFICFGQRGQRFLGCGFGPDTKGIRVDSYDSSGDYLGSGIDGMEIYVHGNAQDQLGQILKSGKLVVYGDVGQTFMYGAKGGEVYVLGNAAGRPLINAAGRPRVIINGTALDFLAESFMAGDPHEGGGFVILNGMTFNDDGGIAPLETPYPGSNIFSLASGGAIFVRDPEGKLSEEQLNGGRFRPFVDEDWELIRPYLEENERLFGISIDNDILEVEGRRCRPHEVYRVIGAAESKVLSAKKPEFLMNEEWGED
jgi:glutamate synthase domain-containing protein 1/glutamate synthase domain-containing protein 3